MLLRSWRSPSHLRPAILIHSNVSDLAWAFWWPHESCGSGVGDCFVLPAVKTVAMGSVSLCCEPREPILLRNGLLGPSHVTAGGWDIRTPVAGGTILKRKPCVLKIDNAVGLDEGERVCFCKSWRPPLILALWEGWEFLWKWQPWERDRTWGTAWRCQFGVDTTYLLS